MNRKAGTPLAILILTLGIIAVLLAAWFVFLTKQDFHRVQTQSPEILDEVYAKESEINYYVSQTMENAAEDTSPLTEKQFLNNFKQEIDRNSLKQLIPELEDIDEQLTQSNVEISDNEIKLKLKFKIEKKGELQGRELALIEYIYEKDFTTTTN